MRSNFRFKFLLLVAIMALCFSPIIDAQVIQPVAHYIASFTTEHVFTGVASLASIPLLATYVKENCTILPTDLSDLVLKYGKIKVITVVIEPPIYDAEGNVTDKGEFYSYAVKRPDSSVVRILMNYAKQGKTDEYLQTFIKNLVVAGDTDTLNKDGLVYLGFATKVDEFLKPYESFLGHA